MKKLFSILIPFAVLFTAGALNAQTLTIAPTSLSFSAQSNGAVQTQSLAISSSTATQFFASTNAAWLRIKQQGDTGNGGFGLLATTPAMIVVVADPTGLPAGGPYNAAVSFSPTAGGATETANVSMMVSTIGATPSPVTFAYQLNGAVPNPVTLTLAASQSTNYTVTPATTTGGAWFTVPGSGTAPGSLAISLNPAVIGGLAPQTYNGSVTITPATGPAITVPVSLTVTAAPTVTVNPSNGINLNYQDGGATGSTNTPTQTLTLTNPGTQDLFVGITAVSTENWLSFTPPPNGVIPAGGSASVAVTYLTSVTLPAGVYSGSLAIFVPNAADTQINVTVHLLVSASPLLTVPSATLAFNYQIGGTAPAAKTVTATSTQVAADAAAGQQMALFITKSDNSAWLTIPSSGTTGSATPISVSVNPAGLAVGTYNATISILGANAANNPQTIPVTLTVSNDPLVVASFGGCSTANTGNNGCPLNFPIQTGQNNPVSQAVRVQSSTGAPASFTATATTATSAACGTGWLSTGVTTAVVSSDTTFTITVTPGSIAAGTTCTGTITIAGINPTTGATLPNSPITIPVTMYISATSLLVVNPVALNFNIAPNTTSSQSFAVTSTSSTNLNFTAAATTNVPWLASVFPGAGSTAAGSNTITVIANSSGFPPGTYNGSITITSTTAGVLDSPLTVPVTLTVTAATMSATPASLTFNQTLGGAVPAAQKVTVSTSSTDITFGVGVSMDNGTGWLSATPISATATLATPATITVSADGSKLTPGTYTGTVTLNSLTTFTTGSPINIKVTLVVSPGTLSATPASLTFNQVQNGQAPPAQPIAVAGAPGPLAFTVTTSTNNNTGNWLTVDTTTGTSPANVKVSMNSGSLPVGQYTGKVTITSTGATGSPVDIPVTLNVVASQTLAVSPATVNFSYVLNSANTPQPQSVQLTGTGVGTQFTTSVPSSAAWLSVTPATGTVPAALSIAVNTAGLAAGNYTGTISVNSPSAASNPAASISVNLTVTSVPKPVFTAVANAASYIVGQVSPGENVVIFGSGLGPATLTFAKVVNGSLETTVANTRVLFDGVPAPIYYVSAAQTSVFVPYGIAGRPSTTVVIEYQGVQSAPLLYTVVNTAPGIYTANSAGSGQGAILNQDYSYNGSGAGSVPAAKNSVVAVYMTGEGTTAPSSPDGMIAPSNGTGLFKPILPVTATVGGIPATVEYYGSAPGIVYGVMQVNVRIPANAPSGAVPIVINVGNSSTQTGSSAVTVAVQ